MNQETRGFTLVELLVVISIIVVLIALLTPAMDKAIYQAELAVCGARLKAISSSVALYAMDQQRAYPYRPSNEPSGQWHRANNLSDMTLDDRKIFKGYIELDTLVDPLCDDVDLSVTEPVSYIFSSYQLWFGFRYTHPVDGGKGMMRIGDRLEFDKRKFRVIAGDQDAVMPAWPGGFSSHPDSKKVMYLNTMRNVNAIGNEDLPPVPGAPIIAPTARFTGSYWEMYGVIERGEIDTQYVFDDGAVQRYNDVEWNESYDPAPRFARIPIESGWTKEMGEGHAINIPIR